MEYKTIGLKEKKGNKKIHIPGFNCFITSHVIANVCYPTYQICTDIWSSPSLLEPHQSHHHHWPGLFQQTPKVSLLPLSPSHSLFLTQQPDRHDCANYLFKTLQWLLTQIKKQRLSSGLPTGPHRPQLAVTWLSNNLKFLILTPFLPHYPLSLPSILWHQYFSQL